MTTAELKKAAEAIETLYELTGVPVLDILDSLDVVFSEKDLTEICEGTNKKNDHQYYLERKRIVGDLHGQGPLLWCVNALLEK